VERPDVGTFWDWCLEVLWETSLVVLLNRNFQLVEVAEI